MRNTGKNLLFLMSILVILVSAIYLILVTLKVPYIGLNVEKNDLGEWRISQVDHLGWAAQQGIQVGDIVTQLNQNIPDNSPTVKKYGVIENVQDLEVIQIQNGPTSYHVTRDGIPKVLIYHTVIPTVIFIILLIFSSFLLMKKRKDKSAIVLILFFLAIGFGYLGAGASARTDSIARIITGISFLFMPVLFLHFLYRYFIRYSIYIFNKKLLIALYLINGMLIVIDSIFMFSEIGQFYFIIRRAQLAIFSVSIVICISILIFRYIRYRKIPTIYNPVLKIMVFGILLAFLPFVVFAAIPRALFGFDLIPGAVTAVFLIFIPIIFIYLVTAKRLFDIDFIINRIRYYSILAFFPTTFIVLSLINFINRDFTLVQWILAFLVTYTGIIMFLFFKEELDFRFRRKLFSEKYNFQASLDRLSHDISKVMKVSDLEERLIEEVKEVLLVKSVSVLEMDKNSLSLSLKRGDQSPLKQQMINRLQNDPGEISIGELIDLNNGVCFLIGEKKDKFHLLWLGEKQNRTKFNPDELVWMKTIARYVSIVYENLHLIEGLMEELEESVHRKDTASPWILRLLFSLSEKERRRLASDLHDSALQDQLLWYRKLETISKDKTIPLNVKKQLNYVKEGLLDVMHQIRKTCNELRPPLLKETGIVEALEILFDYAQLRSNFIVHFKAKDFEVDLEDEQVLALYRIVQELLTNAARHSNATQVDINLECSNEAVYLIYRDNGIGMNLENLEFSFQHMGLSGIKERIRSLEGETDFRSTLDSCFEVSIWFPIKTLESKQESVG